MKWTVSNLLSLYQAKPFSTKLKPGETNKKQISSDQSTGGELRSAGLCQLLISWELSILTRKTQRAVLSPGGKATDGAFSLLRSDSVRSQDWTCHREYEYPFNLLESSASPAY